MSDITITIVVIVLTATLMFVFPLMTMADRTDDVAQLTVQTATTEFVDDIRTTGVLTMEKYSKYVEKIQATGNTYDVELEIRVLDENPGKKTTQADPNKIGENVYYTMYTSQILDKLASGPIKLKEGDFTSASAKNTNTSIGQDLKNFFYKVSGNENYTVGTSSSGMVTANGGR